MSCDRRRTTDTPVRVVIPSRKRVEECRYAITLFENPTVCVAESELDDYIPLGCQIVTHPDNIVGLAAIRQWILDNFDDRVLVQVDDDTKGVRCACAEDGEGQVSRWIRDPSAIMQILANAAFIADKIGAPVFGFSLTYGDIRKYDPLNPCALSGWVSSVLGFVGRAAHYDTSFRLRDDIDMCLRVLRDSRILWIDNRFGFVQKKFGGQGGNALYRSEECNQIEIEKLQQRWGKWVSFSKGKAMIRTTVRVIRKQGA